MGRLGGSVITRPLSAQVTIPGALNFDFKKIISQSEKYLPFKLCNSISGNLS